MKRTFSTLACSTLRQATMYAMLMCTSTHSITPACASAGAHKPHVASLVQYHRKELRTQQRICRHRKKATSPPNLCVISIIANVRATHKRAHTHADWHTHTRAKTSIVRNSAVRACVRDLGAHRAALEPAAQHRSPSLGAWNAYVLAGWALR